MRWDPYGSLMAGSTRSLRLLLQLAAPPPQRALALLPRRDVDRGEAITPLPGPRGVDQGTGVSEVSGRLALRRARGSSGVLQDR